MKNGPVRGVLSPARTFRGAPGRARTCNPRFRRPVLYPVELQALTRNGKFGILGPPFGARKPFPRLDLGASEANAPVRRRTRLALPVILCTAILPRSAAYDFLHRDLETRRVRHVSEELFPSFLGGLGPEHFMRQALREAERAHESDEVPVGAIIVDRSSQRIIARAHNQRELLRDPTAHAEILAITQAAAHYDSWRLSDCALYVTLEPCVMCAGAIVAARIPEVFYGVIDPKAGAHRSVFEVLENARHNHVPLVRSGFLEHECSRILKDFFAKKRVRKGEGGGGNGAG